MPTAARCAMGIEKSSGVPRQRVGFSPAGPDVAGSCHLYQTNRFGSVRSAHADSCRIPADYGIQSSNATPPHSSEPHWNASRRVPSIFTKQTGFGSVRPRVDSWVAHGICTRLAPSPEILELHGDWIRHGPQCKTACRPSGDTAASHRLPSCTCTSGLSGPPLSGSR
jgi:hypothetical protein